MNCPECGAPVTEDRKHCGECGAPLAESPPTNTSPPSEDHASNALIDVPPEQESLIAATSPVEASDKMSVATGCNHVIGKVKENDQDFCAEDVIDYPLHGYRVILSTGADGIGGGTGGERWAATTVHLFLAAMGVRLPAFDQEEKFVDREQFWQLLTEKVKMYFFPTINWVTGCIYSFGVQEVGLDKQQRPAKVFGATWTATVTICDLKKGRSIMHGYAVGDPTLFLITSGQVEKLNTDDVREGRLDRWVGQGQQANGQVFVREFQLDQANSRVDILQCSDGLTNMLSPEDIADIVRREADPRNAVAQLIELAINVQVPYGQITNPSQDPPVTPGDDNVFAGIVSMRSTQGATDEPTEPTDAGTVVPDALRADEDGRGADTDGESLRQHPDAGEERG